MQLLILDLPLEDVVCKHIFCYLTLKDVYRLKLVCKLFANAIPFYLQEYRNSFDLADIGKDNKRFGKNDLNLLLSGKTNLKGLYINSCRHWIKDDILIPVLKNNKQSIETLDLEDCYNLSNDFFFNIGDYLLQLKYLNFSFCRNISADALMYVGENLRHLEELNVTGCWAVNDLSIIVIASNNPKIKVLRLHSCYSITNEAVYSIAKNCLQLRILDITGCWRVKDSSIIMINEYCKQLKELYIKDCTNITEISLARLRPKNVKLDRIKPILFSRISEPLMNI